MATVAYCVKCKAKKEMKDAKETTFKAKGGKTRNAMKGVCPTCGTTMFRIMSSK
jgi:Zn finger protein HypA/HybF involved in hydrogenase expression